MRVDTLCWYLIKPQIKHQGKDWKSSSEFGEYTRVKSVFQTLFVLLKFLVLYNLNTCKCFSSSFYAEQFCEVYYDNLLGHLQKLN